MLTQREPLPQPVQPGSPAPSRAWGLEVEPHFQDCHEAVESRRKSDMNTTLPVVQLDILVVEDHKETRAALQRLLKRWGHEVRSARTLLEAYQCLSEKEFDVILLDIVLPDGEGFELLERASVGHAYVVVVSGWQTEENMFKASAHG